jgi:hypothetical protein
LYLLTLDIRFADRDLMMRFRGGGVGHKSTREATDFFKKDRDKLDFGSRTMSEDMDTDSDDAVDEVDEELEGDSGVDEDIEDEFGYTKEDSDSADESDEMADVDGVYSDDFGPEDDGGEMDSDMEALGYAVM